jgi:hypothetical protein
MHYESLGYYRGRAERALSIGEAGSGRTWLLVFDRKVDEEQAEHFGLLVDLTRAEVEEVFAREGTRPVYAGLSPTVLATLRAHLVEAATWTTQHPACQTWLAWLRDAGFREVRSTHNGGEFARRLFERLPGARKPGDLGAVDELLRPLVEVTVELEAPAGAPPGEWEPWITATR